MNTVADELAHADWYNETWLETMLKQIPIQFEQACKRWRSLYRAAKGQQKAQQKIIDDHSRSKDDHDQAKRLRQEAESQIELLTEAENIIQSDFYSYRYFASEGFLPGYSFPRLPLSAYIPGRRIKGNADEFLSRPRFLAISEFGPRAIIYHEGSRYIINKVNLPVAESEDPNASGASNPARQAMPGLRLFPPDHRRRRTGFVRALRSATERNAVLALPPAKCLHPPARPDQLGRRRAHAPGLRAAHRGALPRAGARPAGSPHGLPEVWRWQVLATVTYASSATLWRINLGWKRRADPNQKGFLLDVERGFWAKQSEQEEAASRDDPMSPRIQRVTPYVEDTKNCLLFEPAEGLDEGQMASLQAALKAAIQVHYQLEDDELAAEPLPSRG